MSYSFNQTAEIDLLNTNLSAAAKAIVEAALAGNPAATKKDILEVLYAEASNASALWRLTLS